MRKRISVTNNTAMVMFVASQMIQPGDTRDFDEDQVPEHLRPQGGTNVVPDEDAVAAEAAENARLAQEAADAAEAEAKAVAKAAADAVEAERLKKEADEKAAAEALAGKRIADILAGNIESIKASLPALTDDEVVALETAEKAKTGMLGIGGPRKGLLDLLAAEILARVE